MGQLDQAEKLLEDYEDVFADIVNVLLFDGKEVVNGSELSPAKTDSQYKASDNQLHEQERDVAKYWNQGGIRIAIYGLENQTAPDKDMPLRIFNYEGESYRSQLLKNEKTNQRYPAITLVLYFGTKKWDYPTTLHDAIPIRDELKEYVNDFKINLFQIAYLSDEQIKMFKSDFGIVAEYFSLVRRKLDPQKYMDKKKFHHVDAVMKLLEAMTGDKRFGEAIGELDKGGHKMDATMSSVLDLIEEKGEQKARIICYINCRKRDMTIEDAQGISELSGELAQSAEKQYQKEARK